MIRAGRSRDGQPTAPSPEEDAGPLGEQPSAAPGTETGATSPADEDTEPGRGAGGKPATGFGHRINGAVRRAYGRPWVGQLTLILLYEAAGIGVTWPRFTYLADGKLPATPDAASYVWYFWWLTHQLLHPGNPFFTTYMAAPVGIQLGFSTTMPLAGWLTAPITVVYGPAVSYTLLTIITPGLLCYAMYRAARLWLRAPGAIVAGAFFGLSSMLMWQNWYHLNISMGSIFLPVTLEAAVRLRRTAGKGPAIALGAALGASLLVNQETTVVAVVLAAVVLIPWLVATSITDRATLRRALVPLGIGAVVGLVVASPQLIGMIQQIAAGGASPPPGQLADYATQFGVPLPTLFAPSPRLAYFGLVRLTSAYGFNNQAQTAEAVPTFGVVLSGLAVLGVIVGGWRKRQTWRFLALWLIPAVFSLGTSLTFGSSCNPSQARPGVMWGRYCHQYLPLLGHLHGVFVTPATGGHPFWTPVVVSNLMPYTWLVRIPWLAGLREADRFAIAGLMGVSILAGMTVDWLARRRATMPLIAVVVAFGAIEAGWSGGGPTMPTTLPAVDRLLSHDHSNSIVVDVPFGLRGGVGGTGAPTAPNALLLATHDGHPRAYSYTSWVPQTTSRAISAHAFYRYLMAVETGGSVSAAQIRQARADLRTMNVGWVVEWRNVWRLRHPIERYGHVNAYLNAVGFRYVEKVCLVPAPSVALCPSTKQQPSQEVWLYRYARARTAGQAG